LDMAAILTAIINTCTVAALGLAAVAAATAQQFPLKPVRVILPFAPGGPTDLLGRVVGQKMTESWGQAVVVESRSGANGIVATEFVAKSAPDGYTLLIGTNGTHGINASLFPKLPYDAINDFAPIGRIGFAPYVLVAHPSLPVRNAKELIQLAKGAPGQIACAAGGSPSQLACALFNSLARIDLLLIPFKGNSLAVSSVMGGETSLVFGGVAQSAPQIRAGRLRAIGVTSLGRSAVIKEVPAIAESGLPGYEVSTWYGLFAPAATPRAVVERLNAELVRILGLGDVRERLGAEAYELPADTPEVFSALIKAELGKWAKVVKDTGVRPE
jgi:tripartite-type tricarboxylate transporter receptor subunit TctC